MLGWYIKSSRIEESYLKVVERTVGPAMDYFCDKVNETEFDGSGDGVILKVFDDIIQTMPFLTLESNVNNKYLDPDDFFIRYNRDTVIRFNDGLKSIKRDIVINKILE
jgi:hypothetical protein